MTCVAHPTIVLSIVLAGLLASFAAAPLSTPRAEPMVPTARPKTGAADLRALSGWLVLVAAIELIAGGWLLRRSRRQLG